MTNKVLVSDVVAFLQQSNATLDSIHPANELHDHSLVLTAANSFHHAQHGEVTFLRRNWLRKSERKCNASLVLTDDPEYVPTGLQSVLHVKNPRYWFAKLCQAFFSYSHLEILYPANKILPELIANGRVSGNCRIAENALLNPEISIGNNSVIQEGAIIYGNTSIQENVSIGPLSVIGKSGFAFEKFGEEIVMLPHYGGVFIGNRARIGSHTCIDRGTFGMTEIHDDVMIDNLVHVAHNVKLQSRSLVVAGAVLCGSVEIGCDVWIGAGALVRESLGIGDGALVGMGSVVVRPIPARMVVVGNPARELKVK